MDVGIVIPVFLPDDGPDFCGEGVGADAGVFTGAVGNEVLNDGADVPVFGDALAAADGDPEAEEDVVDPVAALGGKLGKVVPFRDEDAQGLDWPGRDV